jgi:ribosome-associated protein
MAQKQTNGVKPKKASGGKTSKKRPAGSASRPGADKRRGAGASKRATGPVKVSSRGGAPRAADSRLGKRSPLRKPVARGPVDVGVGAVEILPLPGNAASIGITAAEAALEKKAFDVRSVTHLGALCDAVEEAMRKKGERVLHSDGRHAAEPDWILLDYGDLMVHLFRQEARDHTRLEDYYASARLVAKWKNE